MEKIICKTLEACLGAIQVYESMGMEVPEYLLLQKEEFERKEKEISEQKKIDERTPIFSTLRANSKFTYSKELTECITTTVDKLLEDGDDARQPGLLLGKIQCGKTNTFENIIGLSFDKGIDVCIVLTKGTNTLATQTIERLKYDFRFFKETQDLNQRNIVYVNDILEYKKNGLTEREINRPYCKRIIVCKKENQNLKHLLKLFTEKSPLLKEKKILVVDDEADFASRNYISKFGNTRLAKLSNLIEQIVDIPNYCRYLQVTATPYSLYLQPDGYIELQNGKAMPWRPRFTTLVPVHDKYIGGDQYYVLSKNQDSMYSHLFYPVKPKCIEVLGKRNVRYLKNCLSSTNITDLRYAIVSYFMATAIRKLQEEANGKIYRSSGLIHVEVAKKNHQWQKELVDAIISEIHKEFTNERISDMRIITILDKAYEDYSLSNQKGRNENLISVDIPSKDKVIECMREIFKTVDYNISVVNSDDDVSTMLNEEGQLKLSHTVNIFIGGSILDRGITISNMLCFFYGRNPKKFQQDTVLQHARMYGARDKKDMAVTRFYTTQYIYSILSKMNEIDNQLREWFVNNVNDPLQDPSAVFIGYDKDIKPCSDQKIKVANTMVLKKQTRIVPKGFQTGPKSSIAKTIQKIDSIITGCSTYKSDDFFEIDKNLASQIISLIRSTYIYDNEDLAWDTIDMIGAIEYTTKNTNGKLWCWHRVNRNISRFRNNGNFSDAPEDGRTDMPLARAKAIDEPVLMLFKENGKKEDGWRDTPFYWPSFLTQENIKPVVFTLNSNKNSKGRAQAKNFSQWLDDYNDEEILQVSVDKSDFNQIENGDKAFESIMLTQKNASNYLQKEENGKDFLLNKELVVDFENFSGIHSFNKGVFPYVLKDIKCILFRNSDHGILNGILVELDKTDPYKLYWAKGDEKDVLIDKSLKTSNIYDNNIGNWIIEYKLGDIKWIKSLQ